MGGESGFKEVVTRAKAAGVKLLVDATTRISAKGANRKYRDLVCHSLDENGNLRVIPGTDGFEFDWQDSVQLNYRKKAAWDLLVSEISEWAAKGVDGTWTFFLQYVCVYVCVCMYVCACTHMHITPAN